MWTSQIPSHLLTGHVNPSSIISVTTTKCAQCAMGIRVWAWLGKPLISIYGCNLILLKTNHPANQMKHIFNTLLSSPAFARIQLEVELRISSEKKPSVYLFFLSVACLLASSSGLLWREIVLIPPRRFLSLPRVRGRRFNILQDCPVHALNATSD